MPATGTRSWTTSTSARAGRKQLVWEFERRVLGEMAYQLTTLWWHRIAVHPAKLKGWKITPTHFINQDLVDVWLAG